MLCAPAGTVLMYSSVIGLLVQPPGGELVVELLFLTVLVGERRVLLD